MSEKKAKSARKKTTAEKYNEYRKGGEGCCLWAEENIRVPIFPMGSEFAVWVYIKDLPRDVHPQTGRSYWSMWEKQKEVLKEALQMKDGLFIHRLIVFCWPRGEGKSFMANLIQIWRFFCWPKQKIVLCSNSKEQSSFLQYEEIKSMIENSPKLLALVGKSNLLENEIRRKNSQGHILSKIQSISSFSGIVSNITGYAFSEFFECQRPAFFEKVDGSIRNMPNSIGVIDSTVSSKEHKLYELYQAWIKKEDVSTYFSYRFSKEGEVGDFWHPYQTQIQLDSYKSKFKLGGFARYFLNLWSAGAEKVFSQEEVEAVRFLGVDKTVNCQKQIIETIRRKYEILDGDRYLEDEDLEFWDRGQKIADMESRLWPVEDVYKLHAINGVSVMAETAALDRLSDIYDTDWAIIGGIDRADPTKGKRTAARTVFTVVAKGLPGSRSNPSIGTVQPGNSDTYEDKVLRNRAQEVRPEFMLSQLSYYYFLLYAVVIHDHSTESLKSNILMVHDEYDGLDMVGSERYAAWDLKTWGEEKEIEFVLFHSTYALQLPMFSYLYNLIDSGRFKSPPTGVPGSKEDDLVLEELKYFDHDPDSKKFGSPEKNLKTGVQDDWMYAFGNGIFAGRTLGVNDFRPRQTQPYWGTMLQPSRNNLLGNW
ncbi:MAG: hypothetical protein R6U27_17560 [Desulfobacterales bacterium]